MPSNPEIKISITTQGKSQVQKDIQDITSSANKGGQSIAAGVLVGNVAFSALQKTVEIVTGTIQLFANTAVSLTETALKQSASLEQYQIGFQTLTGSATAASSILTQLKKDAAATPFELPELAQATQLLMGAGLGAEEARKQMLDLGDAVSATGGGADQFQRMAYNLSQIRNQGRATAMDIRQFGFANINIFELLADSMGKTAKEIQEMDATAFTFEDISKALDLANNAGKRYFGGMENQSRTFNGRMSTLSDNFKNMLSDAFNDSGGFGIAKDILERLVKLVDMVKPVLIASFSKIVEISQRVGMELGNLFNILMNNKTVQELGTYLQQAFTKDLEHTIDNIVVGLQEFSRWIESDEGHVTINRISQSVRDFNDSLRGLFLIAEALEPVLIGIGKAILVVSEAMSTPVGRIIMAGATMGLSEVPHALQGISTGGAKFAGGGVVGGNSFSGDRVPIMANSGEMMLNMQQQSTLFRLLENMQTSKSVNFNGNVNIGGQRSDTQNQMGFVNMLMNGIK